jgi:RNA polymerase sigma-70 factor (ECF subfamily)
MLYAYLRSVVFDPHAAEDLYQEALLVAWNRLDDYDRERPFGAWLRGIARNLVLAYCRKHERAKLVAFNDDVMEGVAAKFDELEAAHPGDWDVKLEALRVCLAALGSRDREVVSSHYRDELDCGAIAAQTGLGVEVVKKRLQRARAALAECILRRSKGKVASYGA